MKKTSAALFELIHSLSMAEKKYFKMFSSLKGGDKNYLKLYDAIEKQHIYNEIAIRRACRGQKFLQYLAVANSRLYNNILRSLENYHSGADANLHSQLNKAKILLRKGLTVHALKLLKKAKLIAYEYEQWELLMEMLTMERISYSATNLLKMSPLNEEMEAVLKKLNNINDYRTLHHKIIHKSHEAGPMRRKKEQSFIEKLIRHPLLRTSKQASCTEAKTYYYEIMSRYYLLKPDYIKGYKISKEQCDFIATHLHQLRDSEKRYIFALNILSIFTGYLLPVKRNLNKKKEARILSDKYDKEMQEVLQKIRNYPIISGLFKAEYWVSSYVNELNAFMRVGDFEKIFPILKAIEENKDRLNQAPDVTRIELYYNMTYMLFGTGSYNEALIWLRKIIDQPANSLRQDAQALARVLYLILHYELHKEDKQLLNSLERSTLYFLSTRHRLFKVENALMHCLRQITGKAISKKERSVALHEFKANLLKLMKNPFEKVVMEEFDFLSWVESKIQNKTFAEVVREKAIKI